MERFIRKARPTGKGLGRGSYGSVIELRMNKEIVAGKVFNIEPESATRILMPNVDRIVKLSPVFVTHILLQAKECVF